jgi:hypothetical protein
VSYGSAMGARSVQQLRETAIELQAHYRGGDVDAGLAELEAPAGTLIDDQRTVPRMHAPNEGIRPLLKNGLSRWKQVPETGWELSASQRCLSQSKSGASISQKLGNAAVVGANIRPACCVGEKTVATKSSCTFMRDRRRFVDAHSISILIIPTSTS